MCLIAFALDCHRRYRLVLGANRDEYFRRPTAPAGFWEDAPQVLAGRDLEAGGTWLGVTRTGRLAAITNYREPGAERKILPSRGRLVADFLTGRMTRDDYRELLVRDGGRYGGFNLLFGDDSGLSYYSNRDADITRIPSGVHGLSNHLLDTPWPKVATVQRGLDRLIRDDGIEAETLFAMLAASDPFPDDLLPDTGVGPERERFLSPIFITGTDYGTRSSTVILIGRDNRVTFLERSFDDLHRVSGYVRYRIEPGMAMAGEEVSSGGYQANGNPVGNQ
jgi:uncharacterized protein with NRDE domain